MAEEGFESIPVIDLSGAAHSATRPAVLRELRHALLNIGFLYISNHGISEKVIDRLRRILPELFALPAEDKRRVALTNSPHFLGYSGAGTEITAGQADAREQFEFATELADDWTEGKPLAERLRGPNQVILISSVHKQI